MESTNSWYICKMMSYNEAMKLLRKSGASESVIDHCIMVSKKATEIAEKIKKNGHKIDVELCKVGGLLHDIGRSKTHSVRHGIEGAKILKDHPKLARIAERHIGGGIDKEDAKRLGLGDKDYLPETLEEKVVCYADKLVQGDRFTDDASEEYDKLEKRLGKDHPTIIRLRKIEDEIMNLLD